MLAHQELLKDGCSHGNRENDRCNPGSKEKRHGKQEATIGKRAGKVGWQHDGKAARCEQSDSSRDHGGKNRPTKEETRHQVSSLSCTSKRHIVYVEAFPPRETIHRLS